jgi:hypothetical protein
MNADTQGDFCLRPTGNYFDLVQGERYHLQPITFHEFLTKPAALFMFEETFMQIPGYVPEAAELMLVEEHARQYIVSYIMDAFEPLLLGMQDYERWGQLFEQKCASLCPSLWAQINMIDNMLAKDLEMDENTSTNTTQGNAQRLGGQQVTTEQTGTSDTTGSSKTKQDVDNTQDTDSYTREATATVVRAEGQLNNDLEYNWDDAADNIREARNRAGDTNQHMESETETASHTEQQNSSTSVTSMNNMSDQNTSENKNVSQLTNKQFMQERRWAIETAQLLQPLEWFRSQLRPMFYMLY